MLEAYSVRYLPLQLRITQTIPCLEDEWLHHEHGVHVGSASSGGLVSVHGLDDGEELVPVDLFFNLG